MKKWIRRLLAAALVAIAAVLVGRMWFASAPVRVRVAHVERGPVEATVSNSKAGTVKARRRAHLTPQVGGAVVEVACRKGERVEQGQKLARLDDSRPRAEAELARRELLAAEAVHARTCISADRAFKELERNRGLAQESIVSADALEERQSAYELALASCKVASADVERARAAVDLALVEVAKCTLSAPFAGVIADTELELGEWITPPPVLISVAPVVDLVDPSSLYISAPMDEVDAGRIHVGQVARVTLDPYPDRTFAGSLVRVASYVLDVEQQNRTVEVEVELDDESFTRSLLPGTSADVEVVLERRDNALRLPTSSVIEGGRVLVVEGNRLVERTVRIGLRNWEYSEVIGGLSEGETVVRSLDRTEVRAGADVEIEPEARAP